MVEQNVIIMNSVVFIRAGANDKTNGYVSVSGTETKEGIVG